VRSRARPHELESIGCDLVEGDALDLTPARIRGSDALVHGAAIYEIGVDAKRRREMEATNVEGTRRALASAREAEIGRVVFVSTIAAFGNTERSVVSEGFEPRRPPTYGPGDLPRSARAFAPSTGDGSVRAMSSAVRSRPSAMPTVPSTR
jgi:nucleoside-diphosphate-sugar epimerase